MANKNVKIETVELAGKPKITVDKFKVELEKKNWIKFHNDLLGIGSKPKDGVALTIQFYEIVDGVVTKPAVSGFCKDESSNEFIVKANDKRDCTVQIVGEFKYDVSADGYDLYDPVIIVEPPPAFMLTGPEIFVAIVLIVSAFMLGT